MTTESILYDYSKLEGKIREKFETQAKFADAMGLSERTISMKLNNLRPWKHPEMRHALEVLGLSIFDMVEYFYTVKVQ